MRGSNKQGHLCPVSRLRLLNCGSRTPTGPAPLQAHWPGGLSGVQGLSAHSKLDGGHSRVRVILTPATGGGVCAQCADRHVVGSRLHSRVSLLFPVAPLPQQPPVPVQDVGRPRAFVSCHPSGLGGCGSTVGEVQMCTTGLKAGSPTPGCWQGPSCWLCLHVVPRCVSPPPGEALSPPGPSMASSFPSPHASMMDHWASGIEGLQSTCLPQEGCGTQDSAAQGQSRVQAALAQRLA